MDLRIDDCGASIGAVLPKRSLLTSDQNAISTAVSGKFAGRELGVSRQQESLSIQYLAGWGTDL